MANQEMVLKIRHALAVFHDQFIFLMWCFVQFFKNSTSLYLRLLTKGIILSSKFSAYSHLDGQSLFSPTQQAASILNSQQHGTKLTVPLKTRSSLDICDNTLLHAPFCISCSFWEGFWSSNPPAGVRDHRTTCFYLSTVFSYVVSSILSLSNLTYMIKSSKCPAQPTS